MAGTLKLEVVTPEAKIFSGDVEIVQLSGKDGDMGILPGHMLLMTELAAGELMMRINGKNSYLAVGEGFVQVTPEKVSILTDMAIAADNIDEAKAQEALTRAQARLAQKLSDEDASMVQAALVHATAQLKVKRSQRR